MNCRSYSMLLVLYVLSCRFGDYASHAPLHVECPKIRTSMYVFVG
jgi:hypothetical protein